MDDPGVNFAANLAPTFRNPVEANESILCVPQDEGKDKWGDSMSFEFRSDVRQGCVLSLTLFNYIIDWSLSQGLQSYPGVWVFSKRPCVRPRLCRRHRAHEE